MQIEEIKWDLSFKKSKEHLGDFMAKVILRLPAVKSRTGLSRSAIYSLIAQGNFPKQIFLGERTVGWLEEEIEAWLSIQIQHSRNPREETK